MKTINEVLNAMMETSELEDAKEVLTEYAVSIVNKCIRNTQYDPIETLKRFRKIKKNIENNVSDE